MPDEIVIEPGAEGGGDSGAEEIVEGAEGTDGGDGGEGGDGQGGDGQGGGERQTVDNKKLATQLRAALKTFSQQNPEFIKQNPRFEKAITGALYKETQLNELGGLTGVLEKLETLDIHGGAEGLAKMAEEVEEGRNLEAAFGRGDPQVIDGWAKDYPEGFKRLVLPALNKLETLDPTQFDNVASHAQERLYQAYGMWDLIGQMKAAIDAGKIDDVKALFGRAWKFWGDSRGLAKKAGEDPLRSEREQLNTKEQALESEARKQFHGSVRADVNNQIARLTNKTLTTMLGGKRLNENQANRVRKLINEDLIQTVNTQKGYLQRYQAVMGRNDRDAAIKFIVSSAGAKLGEVTRRVLRDMNLLPGRGTAGGSGGNGQGAGTRSSSQSRTSSGGAQTIGGIPAIADVDFSKTDKAVFLGMKNRGKGEAWLKNGKKAVWG